MGRPATLGALRESDKQHAGEVDDMQPVDSPADAEEFRVVPNRSGLQPGMDDPGAMKQLLEDEDIEHYLRAQADV